MTQTTIFKLINYALKIFIFEVKIEYNRRIRKGKRTKSVAHLTGP